MSHRTLAKWAIAVVVAFIVAIVTYPLIFSPDGGADQSLDMPTDPAP